ncbi:hypothetical protein CJF42_24290 [Pseudoalteromonas sp. NBT06-2]|uniref:DUF2523 family protein n=1 Tax=Pseudoalteromonas sp. NBT06-2 TaxID=2025950 RepID=UPI000BA727D2|nr:DUF2523 family protein [Pseudoalteromonas sp. NBT06-2]PAJ71879.1 hypothetical protein CJF42_24290 [Pseudoalteromonas sp. NBT06-2]
MLDWFASTWNEFKQFLWSVVLSVVDVVKDLGCLLAETLIDLVLFILNSLGAMFDGLNISQYISSIPPHTGYFMTACGFSEAMGMIILSLTIRIILQLIPFTRLGS